MTAIPRAIVNAVRRYPIDTMLFLILVWLVGQTFGLHAG